LLEYDCVHFASYIETIVFANKLAVEQAKKTGNQKNANTTDWLSAKPAGILVQKAMERMYIKRGNPVARSQDAGEDEDELEALREMEAGPGPSTTRARTQRLSAIEAEETRLKKRLPPGSEIVLEELPKWKLLADVLEEIEQTLALEGEEVIDISKPRALSMLTIQLRPETIPFSS
jgi:DNA excision repair protein ERCC-4